MPSAAVLPEPAVPAWSVVPPQDVAPHLLHAASRKEFAGRPVDVADPVLAQSLREQDDAAQWEYAYRWPGPCVVEPTLGYVVVGPGRLVAESLPYSRHIGWPTTAPGPARTRVPAVASLRDTGDVNYYHFLDDVLGRLALFDRVGVPRDVPLLISATLAGQPYFRAALRMSAELRARSWLVQGADEPVEAGEVWFGKPLCHARDTLEASAALVDPAPAPAGDRRLLLLRSPARVRHLTNGAALQAVCRDAGFEAVDGDGLDLAEQVALFRSARHVVGPHGAGLVNLLWRRGADCSLLELFPPDASPAHYAWLCRSFGFGYDALRGTSGSTADGFAVDPDRLADALDRLVAAG